MMSKPRCVLDASVAVSALLFEHSVPARAFFHALHTCEIVVSQPVIDELRAVFARKKFDRYVTREEREGFLERLIREATVVEVSRHVTACRDPKDDKYLSLAVSGSGSFIITGDDDLLVLHPFQGIAIVTPAQFLASISLKEQNGPMQAESHNQADGSKAELPDAGAATVSLSTIAHGRSGDKGNHANVAVIAYTPAGFAWLREHLTADVVRDYFAPLRPTRVVRYEAANVLAFNFVLENVLGGGASTSLRIDSQGKTYALALLQMPISRPADLDAMVRPARSTVL